MEEQRTSELLKQDNYHPAGVKRVWIDKAGSKLDTGSRHTSRSGDQPLTGKHLSQSVGLADVAERV